METIPLLAEGAYDLISKEYDNREWSALWNVVERPRIRKWLLKHPKSRTLLDAACGTAPYYRLITQHKKHYTGIDVSREMLFLAQSKYLDAGGQTFVKGNILNLPFQSETFDLLLCNRSLSHIENVNKAFEEFNRVLRLKGSCLITDIHNLHNYDYTSFDTEATGRIIVETFKHRLTSLKEIGLANGFEITTDQELTLADLANSVREKYHPLIFDKGKYLLIILEMSKVRETKR